MRNAIQVLVDIVSKGKEAEGLSLFVWESLGSDATSKAKRKLSNKIIEAYDSILHGSSKIEIDKAGFLEKAFRPVYTGIEYYSLL